MIRRRCRRQKEVAADGSGSSAEYLLLIHALSVASIVAEPREVRQQIRAHCRRYWGRHIGAEDGVAINIRTRSSVARAVSPLTIAIVLANPTIVDPSRIHPSLPPVHSFLRWKAFDFLEEFIVLNVELVEFIGLNAPCFAVASKPV